MVTAGSSRNGATAMSDVVWKLGDVDRARRSRNTQEELDESYECRGFPDLVRDHSHAAILNWS